MLKFATAQVLSADTGRAHLAKTAHRADFSHHEVRPGYLYVRNRAISSRTNENHDTFPAEELAKSWRTFIGRPVFVNHQNEDHRRARGVVIDAALHEDRAPGGGPDTWVEVLMEVDGIRFPKLAKAIIAGEIDKTSMGCDVDESECSACGNKATTPAEYCNHIPGSKGMKFQKRSANGTVDNVLIHEICRGLRFFENSLLVEPPADPTAHLLGIDASGLDKTAAKTTSTDTQDNPRRRALIDHLAQHHQILADTIATWNTTKPGNAIPDGLDFYHRYTHRHTGDGDWNDQRHFHDEEDHLAWPGIENEWEGGGDASGSPHTARYSDTGPHCTGCHHAAGTGPGCPNCATTRTLKTAIGDLDLDADGHDMAWKYREHGDSAPTIHGTCGNCGRTTELGAPGMHGDNTAEPPAHTGMCPATSEHALDDDQWKNLNTGDVFARVLPDSHTDSRPWRAKDALPQSLNSAKTAAYDDDHDDFDYEGDDEDDEHQRNVEKWDDIHPYLGEIHRGVGVHLNPEDHTIVHDKTRPTAERAAHLLQAIHRAPRPGRMHPDPQDQPTIGWHWTGDENVAEDFAHRTYDPKAIKEGRPHTAVVFHSHKPGRHDINESPDEREGAVYGYHDHGEQEVPLHQGAGVALRGISWKNMDESDDAARAAGYADADDWYGAQDQDFTRHDFGKPGHHTTAARTITAVFGENGEDYTVCNRGHHHWGSNGAAGLLIVHHDPDQGPQYLLGRRADKDVDHGGTWSTPGGAIHNDETPERAAHRETREELGGLPHLTHVHTHIDDHGDWAYHTVIARAEHRFTPRGGDAETAETGWFTPEEFKHLDLHPGFAASWPAVAPHARKTGKRRTASADGYRIQYHHLDSAWGQNQERITAHAPDGTLAGSLDFATVSGEPVAHVQMIDVDEAHRRRGVGTAMVDHLRQQYPGHTIDTGMRTSDGEALTQRLRHKLHFTSDEIDTGGTKWPYLRTLRAIHPEHGDVGSLKYNPPKRPGGVIRIDHLDTHIDHRRTGVGSALMDEMQRRHPGSRIDHGDRTPDGKAWWNAYSADAPTVHRRKGRTMAGLQTQAMPPRHADPADHPFFKDHPVHADHVIAHWAQAEDEEKASGLRWYADAHLLAKALGEAYANGDTGKAAGILSAYSPRSAWPANMHNAARSLADKKALGVGEGVSIMGVHHTLAKKIMDGQDYDTVLKGPKTNAFAKLIHHGGTDPVTKKPQQLVVIDRHALSVACGERLSEKDAETFPSSTPHYYNHAAKAYTDAAKTISKTEGHEVAPHAVQAVTWLVRKRLNRAEDLAAKGGGGKGRVKMQDNTGTSWKAVHPTLLPGGLGDNMHLSRRDGARRRVEGMREVDRDWLREQGISPQEEWHGPYEVVKAGEGHYVVDNANRRATVLPHRGFQTAEQAHRSRDWIDERRAGYERAKGLGESLFNSANEILGDGADEDMRSLRRQNDTAMELHRMFPPHDSDGRHGFDENGEPHYEIDHPHGWQAHYRGGTQFHIHHPAVDHEVAVQGLEGVDMSHGYGAPEGMNSSQLHRQLNQWATESGPDYARAYPQIGQWNRRRQAAKTAYGETKAPADVDTLRSDACEVCGNSEGWDGQSCPVCFTGETLIRTISGYRPIAEIREGDQVLAGDGKYHPVLSVHVRDYDGPIVKMRTSAMTNPIRVTPEHPIGVLIGEHFNGKYDACAPARCNRYLTDRPAKAGRGSSKHIGVSWNPGRSMWTANGRKPDGGTTTLGYFTSEEEAAVVAAAHREKYPSKPSIPTHIIDFVPAGELTTKTFAGATVPLESIDFDRIDVPEIYFPQTKKGAARRGPRSFELTPDFLWMIGMFLAEGSCGPREVIFSLNKDEIDYQQRLMTMFTDYGFNPRIEPKHGNAVQVSIPSSSLAEWFPAWLGKGCENKTIPADLLNLPIEKARHIFDGVMDGDGCYRFDWLGQTSEILALQMVELGLRMGARPTINMNQRPNRKRVYTVVGPTKQTSRTKSGTWEIDGRHLYQLRQHETEHYQGVVYNLHVDVDPTYTVQNLLVHNCQYVKPPSIFTDPDTSVARTMDLRGLGDQAANEAMDQGADAVPGGLDQTQLQPGGPGEEEGGTPGAEPAGGEVEDPNDATATGEVRTLGDGEAQDGAQAIDQADPQGPGAQLPGGPEGAADPGLDDPAAMAGAQDDVLSCPACGYQTEAGAPLSTVTADPAAPASAGPVAGDVCPQCGKALLVSQAELEGEAAPPEVPAEDPEAMEDPAAAPKSPAVKRVS